MASDDMSVRLSACTTGELSDWIDSVRECGVSCIIDCAGVKHLTSAHSVALAQLTRFNLHFTGGSESLFRAIAMLEGCSAWSWAGSAAIDNKVPVILSATDADSAVWTIHIKDESYWTGWIKQDDSIAWIEAVNYSLLIADLSALSQINSIVIAWLLSLRQATGAERLRLDNMNERSGTLLQQMHLDKVFHIKA